jgi:hypothetical protein
MKRHHHAFTLLEVVLATALAAALMILILTTTVSIRRTQTLLQQTPPPPSDVQNLLSLLSDELWACQSVQQVGQACQIETSSRVDRRVLDPAQGPTRIEYRLVRRGKNGCLIRQQIELENRTNQETQVELMLNGVAGFSLEYSAGQTGSAPSARVEIDWENTSRPPVREWLIMQ